MRRRWKRLLYWWKQPHCCSAKRPHRNEPMPADGRHHWAAAASTPK